MKEREDIVSKSALAKEAGHNDLFSLYVEK